MLRSDLYDYSGTYIDVKGTITVEATDDANKRGKKLTFKNNAPFKSCISKINDIGGIIIEIKWFMVLMKIMMPVIIG